MTDSVIDLRGLDPPEPLLRILDAIAADSAGPHAFLLSREPVVVYRMLAEAGWRHSLSRSERGFELTIRREPRVP
jgi:Uncharacterized conserved protein (DUF2249)